MAIPNLPLDGVNFYLDVIHMVHNQLRQLTLTGDERDAALSKVPVKNIELSPVVVDRLSREDAPSIHISVDSSETANDIDGQLQDFIELLNLRIELYLGCDNDNFRLTSLAATLIDDFRQVLSPNVFVGAPISIERLKLDERNEIKLADGRRIYLINDDTARLVSSRPLANDAKIMNAGILQWGFDERTRGTGDEILVYIFQLELHHHVV